MDPAAHAKASLRGFVELVVNDGRVERVADFVSADYVGHDETAGLVVTGPEGIRGFVAGRRSQLPDLHVRVDDAIAEDDLVVARWTATGARTAWRGISVCRLLAGKQVESWTHWTELRR
jgi:predicted SnoaL-like aldol condensation-catalyzing enzyme